MKGKVFGLLALMIIIGLYLAFQLFPSEPAESDLPADPSEEESHLWLIGLVHGGGAFEIDMGFEDARELEDFSRVSWWSMRAGTRIDENQWIFFPRHHPENGQEIFTQEALELVGSKRITWVLAADYPKMMEGTVQIERAQIESDDVNWDRIYNSKTPLLFDFTPPLPKESAPAPRIGLFAGVGTWDLGVEATGNFLEAYDFDWAMIDESDLKHDRLADDFDIIWLPGGFFAQYRAEIVDDDVIREFVEQGGGFIGTCAGAYYAAGDIRWQGEAYDYPLSLFDGVAVGPLGGQAPWGSQTELLLPDAPSIAGDFDESLDVYYMDGPYFDLKESEDVTVLARYMINDEPAVILFDYGDGPVLLMGPHPELGYDEAHRRYDPEGGEGSHWDWLNHLLQRQIERLE